jgi:ribulose-5-phosphate 4-epimerase/fuculose-1-phosphate aldolase
LKQIFRISRAVVDLVNPLNNANSTASTILIPPKVAKEIVRESTALQNSGHSIANLGEISFRLSGTLEKFIINSSDSSLQSLSEKDLCLVDVQSGRVLGSVEPARHIEWHRMFYKTTDLNCVILCQPQSSLVFGARDSLIVTSIWPEINDITEKFVCSSENSEEIFTKMQMYQFLLIKGVGILAAGENVRQTIWDIEKLERFCQISNQLGEGK